MLSRYLYGIFAFALAFGILGTSFIKLSTISYAFTASSSPSPTASAVPIIDYLPVLPGNVMPGDLLWPVQAVRDRIWYFLTLSHLRKAELALFFSEKRITSGRSLFEKNRPDLGMSTLTKGEKYLETALYEESLARKEGQNTEEFLNKAARASLKQREILQKDILPFAPEQARPGVIVVDGQVDRAFHELEGRLNSMGKDVPKDPFERH